jgi:YbbR domain-containing protein
MKIGGLIIIVALFLAALLFFGGSSGFSNADIEGIKKSIKSKYEKREGVTVLEVQMLKESSRKAVGYVKLKIAVLGEVTKPCSATLAEDGEQTIWRCD